MNEVIKKGYARGSDRTPVDDKLWCLSHHWVYQPANPIKFVVYSTTELSMQVDLSTMSFLSDLT